MKELPNLIYVKDLRFLDLLKISVYIFVNMGTYLYSYSLYYFFLIILFSYYNSYNLYNLGYYFSENYGFVTFVYNNDAYEAVEHGNDNPSLPEYTLSFGGRRAFCKSKYADLGKIINISYIYICMYVSKFCLLYLLYYLYIFFTIIFF